MDGPKDPWPRVLSMFVGDPTSLARDSMFLCCTRLDRAPKPFKQESTDKQTEKRIISLLYVTKQLKFHSALLTKIIERTRQIHGHGAAKQIPCLVKEFS